MALKVITNHHSRELVTFNDLPENVRKDFDYIGDEDWDARFVQYKGEWYDTNDTEGHSNDEDLKAWDSYLSDTFFSGIVFYFPREDDWETVVVGRFYVKD